MSCSIEIVCFNAEGILDAISEPDVRCGLFLTPASSPSAYIACSDDPLAGPLYRAYHDGDATMTIGGGRIERNGFSFFVARSQWGEGYGLCIARKMLDVAVDLYPGLTLLLTIHQNNRASIAIAERIGFHFAGKLAVNTTILQFNRRT